jgi:Bacterial Ig-like domain (group 2)
MQSRSDWARLLMLVVAPATFVACRDGGGEPIGGDASTLGDGSADAGDALPSGDGSTDGAVGDGGSDASADAAPVVPGLVFDDNYAPSISELDFGGAANAISVDTSTAHTGTASLKIVIPASGYTGAALKSDKPEDLSGFDAVTFWAKADVADAFDSLGLGNDAATNTYGAEWSAVPITTSWQKYVVPIPSPAAVTSLDGLFYFACASGKKFHTVWLDDIHYEKLGTAVLGTPSASITNESQSIEIGGATGQIHGSAVVYTIGGVTETIHPGNGESAGWPYFSYLSDAPSIATVDGHGVITGVAAGSANITATLAGAAVTGKVAVTVKVASVPTDVAPTPTAASTDVIALFSSAYTPVPVDTFIATWSTGKLVDPFTIGTHAVKKYTGLGYIGVEFIAHEIDATAMNAFHLDVWTGDAATIRVKLVDFGTNAVFGGGDDSEAELTFSATSTPALTQRTWVSLDLPMSAFLTANPAWNRKHLAQLVLSTADATPVGAFVDNIYFHK